MNFRLQTPEQLSAHLRALRRRQGLSQLEVGQRMGISQSRLARIERDPSSVSFDQLLDLLHVLGTAVVLETDDQRFTSPPEKPPEGGAVTGKPGSILDEPW